MLAACPDCDHQTLVPQPRGHRSCPHCQHHESQQWLERQLQKRVPATYFLLTFTLPAELRPLAWHHQRIVHDLLCRCSWARNFGFLHPNSKLWRHNVHPENPDLASPTATSRRRHGDNECRPSDSQTIVSPESEGH